MRVEGVGFRGLTRGREAEHVGCVDLRDGEVREARHAVDLVVKGSGFGVEGTGLRV